MVLTPQLNFEVNKKISKNKGNHAFVHSQVNCDYEPYVRDQKPVFCEKTTELIDGVYVTTRGCSTYQWEDVDSYLDHRNQVNSYNLMLRGLQTCHNSYDNFKLQKTVNFIQNTIVYSIWCTVWYMVDVKGPTNICYVMRCSKKARLILNQSFKDCLQQS